MIDSVGMGGAVPIMLCWLPQALNIIRERKTRSISLLATHRFPLGRRGLATASR